MRIWYSQQQRTESVTSLVIHKNEVVLYVISSSIVLILPHKLFWSNLLIYTFYVYTQQNDQLLQQQIKLK